MDDGSFHILFLGQSDGHVFGLNSWAQLQNLGQFQTRKKLMRSSTARLTHIWLFWFQFRSFKTRKTMRSSPARPTYFWLLWVQIGSRSKIHIKTQADFNVAICIMYMGCKLLIPRSQFDRHHQFESVYFGP